LTQDAAAEVRVAESALYRAMIAQDFATLRRLLADDLVYIHSTAVAETKDAYLTGVAQGLYDYATIDSRDVTIRIDGATAVQTGTVAMSVSARGEPKQRPSCCSRWSGGAARTAGASRCAKPPGFPTPDAQACVSRAILTSSGRNRSGNFSSTGPVAARNDSTSTSSFTCIPWPLRKS
jgi:hypothetical protein